MKLFIQPNDVLFFRDGRSFDAGGDHVARLQFPPNPITFYGAIRSALIGQSAVTFQDFKEGKAADHLTNIVGRVKSSNEIGLGNLKITDFGLLQKKKELDGHLRLFPVPLDVAQDKESKTYFVLNPQKVGEGQQKVNFPHDDLCLLSNKDAGDKILESPSGFMTEDGLRAYLSDNQLQAQHFLVTEKVFLREQRVGIERSTATLTAEEGQLYSIEFARLHSDVGFCVQVEGLNGLEALFKEHKLLRLGGESRSARYEEVAWNALDASQITNGRFKVVFLTPAIFKNAWIPDEIDTSTLTGTIAGCSAKLIAAAVGKPVGIGGWDIVKGESKPLRRAVPAGSVYYFECIDGGASLSVEPNGFIHVGETQFTQQGLGQPIIGSWNYIGE